MNIDTELFRVLDDAELDLKDTPTVIKPFYRSKRIIATYWTKIRLNCVTSKVS